MNSVYVYRPERIGLRLAEHFEGADPQAKRVSTLIVQLSEFSRKRAETLVKSQNIELSRGEIVVLTCLRLSPEPHELRQSEISERVLMTSGGVTNICKQLLKRQLIKREKDPEDARSSVYGLSDAGVEVANTVIPIIHSTEKKITSCLERDEIQLLCNLLERITTEFEG